MKNFLSLFDVLDSGANEIEKARALTAYFEAADPHEAAWTLALIYQITTAGRLVATDVLGAWTFECAEIPDWLVEECDKHTGDKVETLSALLPPPIEVKEPKLADWLENFLPTLKLLPLSERKPLVQAAWQTLIRDYRFLLNKFLTGTFRINATRRLAVSALAAATGGEEGRIAQILEEIWTPSPEFFRALWEPVVQESILAPLPFCLPIPLETPLETLGLSEEWTAETIFDGLRAQIISRNDYNLVYSRENETLNAVFPEIAEQSLPAGMILDGALVAWNENGPQPLSLLQKRFARKKVTPALLREIPVRFVIFDILVANFEDLREKSLEVRRKILENWVNETLPSPFLLHETLDFENWEALREIRDKLKSQKVPGLLLKKKDSLYLSGRAYGERFIWKNEAFSLAGVLLYAQRGDGGPGPRFVEYTFCVWDGETLLPFAKIKPNFRPDESAELDAYIQQNTIEKFGPVYSVRPERVYEIAFDGVEVSKRHKIGLMVKNPRIIRRIEISPLEAGRLETLRSFLV